MRKQILTTAIALLLLVLENYGQGIIRIGRENNNERQPYTLRGTVIDFEDGSPLPGANVIIERQNLGTSADVEGNFELSLYEGQYTLKVSSIGYKPVTKNISLKGSGNIRFVLESTAIELSEVVVTNEAIHDKLVQKSGIETLSLETIKTLPPLAGERDIVKSLTLLPGVVSQGEVSSGFSVRGGGGDQNLLLFNGATIYNPSHMLGFFSSINSNVISQVDFYKGTVPARYGGRASSVIDIRSRKGNFGQTSGSATLGIVSSNFSVQTPIIDQRLAVFAAGRAAYPNWLIGQAGDPNIRDSDASFWDGNVIFNGIVNENNDVELSLYRSEDNFDFGNSVSNRWVNQAFTLGWNSVINSQLSLDIDAIASTYESELSDGLDFGGTTLTTGLNHYQGNVGVLYNYNDNLGVRVGGIYKYLINNRGDLVIDTADEDNIVSVEDEEAVEASAYIEFDYSFSTVLGVSVGLRYSSFSLLGGRDFNIYDPNRSRSLSSVIGVNSVNEGDQAQFYDGLEPRMTLRFENSIIPINLGVSRNIQYIHLISNSTAPAPNDVWKFSDPYLRPQNVWQYSVGLSKTLPGNMWVIEVDGYYKDLENLVDYKDGADLFANPTLETEVFNVLGESYGLEFFVEKKRGKIKGQVSYTYSRSLRVSNSPFPVEQINRGFVYPANLDIPHSAKIVSTYKLGPSAELNATFNYSSGRAFTAPLGKFEFDNTDFPLFVDRNNDRTGDIHRLDLALSFQLKGSKKIWQGDMVFSVYNVYGKRNAFSAFFQDFPGEPPGLYQLNIIDSPFPSISYEFEF